MRLQLLELSGFKSFPNRSELSFEGGVTAIVGPNGCGKSNLVDAITWVLGEQSAKSLRGERMDDVIFGGSDGRRPTSTAEVRLVLKDVAVAERTNGSSAPGTNGHGTGTGEAAATLATLEADDELLRRPVPRDVELARRLYRSGESEYLIDGHVCRLRDVQDLLMSAGVGGKGYAVIEQGKIGQILSARPNDRRQLIEEAAGVTKFKSRRHAAELKLDAAQQNLSRVDDIIYELEKQRNALKRQSARARRYQRFRDELRRWETVLIGRRHRALVAALELTTGRLTAARARQCEVGAAVSARDEALASRRAELAEREGGALAAREDAHARELDVRRHQQQIAFDRQQIETLRATEAETADALRALEARRDPQQRALTQQREAALEANRERDAAAGRLAEAEAEYERAQRKLEGLESDVEAARGEVFSAINAATALRHAVEHAVAGRERVNEDLTKLDLEAADLARELARTTSQRDEASRLLEDGRSTLARTQEAILLHRAELAEARQQREAIALSLRQAEHELASTQARKRSLEELAAARTGYGDAARLVLSDADAPIVHHGSVADYLEVGRAHERAVEGALGELLEHVIVPTHAEAEAGLHLVRERDAGQCGFLVLEGADERSAPAVAPPLEGLVALRDVVRFVGPHADAIRQAIGHVWIAPSFDRAVTAARATPTPVVTTDGEVLRGPHLVQGAGRGGARGILATKGEIRELGDRLGAMEQRAVRAQDALRDLEQRIDAGDVALASLGAELHEQEKLIVGAELQHTRADEEIERLSRKRTIIETEQRRAAEALRAIESRQLEARASITRLEAEQESADDRLAAAQRRLVDARAAAERLSRIAADEKAAHARLAERSVAGSADVTRVERAVDELEARIRSRADELQRTRDGVATLEAGIVALAQQLDDERLALDHLGEIVQAETARASALHRTCEELDAELRAVRETLDGVRAEVSALEVERATTDGDIGHLAESCAQTLQLTLEDVATAVAQLERDGHLTPDVETLRARDEEEDDDPGPEVQPEASGFETTPTRDQSTLTAEDAVVELRAKIERLGPINMMAIDQFDELETRHTFLSTQRQDLVDSIASTGEAITRIERTTRERFKTAFDTIDGYFQETFATMFGGGRAGLMLLDESDLLESGIDIIAQPPGKRLQSVQLLSGGEKALTAIALMFAIFRYRPSPFCLLDEIDAPLDDANVGRFVQMLRGMLSHTQFILITHNRRTMEIADHLYGVTMEEPGVSKLVSVSLN